jgi:hypothetical protein
MINPDVEIANLRHYLNGRGWLPQEIEDILDLASRDMNEVILDVVSNAVAEATEYAEDLGAAEFIEDIDVVEIGGGWMITTHSGKTDFSVPERKMLPDLVKNGKVSKDGNRYQVIPIGGKKEITQPKDLFSTMRQQQVEQREARASLLDKSIDQRSARAQQMASHFRSIINRRLSDQHTGRKITVPTGDVVFKTASEKQDINTQWVSPAIERDMTGFLMDMNKRIDDTIDSSIRFIAESYEKEFA